VRVGNHISMVRENMDGSRTPLTMSNHDKIKGSTLRTICRQSGIPRNEFLEIYTRVWFTQECSATSHSKQIKGKLKISLLNF